MCYGGIGNRARPVWTVAMQSPSRSAVENTNVPVIVVQASGKPVMGKFRVRNAPNEKDNVLINAFSATSFPCHPYRRFYQGPRTPKVQV